MIFVYRTSAVGPQGTPLSDYEEGAIIKLNEGGSPVEFYVSKHDYESGLNGAGRTLVVRKDCYDQRQWNNPRENDYANSDISNWMNQTYKLLFDQNIQSAINQTKIVHTQSSSAIGYFITSIFLLSITELGGSNAGANIEGSELPISDILKYATINGSATVQWTRSPVTNNAPNIWICLNNGSFSGTSSDSSFGSRPAFTLPSTLLFNPDTNEVVA